MGSVCGVRLLLVVVFVALRASVWKRRHGTHDMGVGPDDTIYFNLDNL